MERTIRVIIGLLFVWSAGGCDRVTPPSPIAAAGIEIEVVAPSFDPRSVRFHLGPPEVVFSYRNDRCEGMDLPDITARAVRMPDGTIALYSGNAPRNYASFGPDFDRLERVCQSALESRDEPDPEGFANQEWLATVYREGEVFTPYD
jgi:hypothetical protein